MVIRSGSSARQWRWRAEASQPSLVRFVLLSMLLHATVVILFGTSQGGGAGRGDGVLDVLDVTLRRQPAVPDAGLRSGAGTEPAAGRALLRHADEHPPVAAPARSELAPAIEPTETSGQVPVEPAPPATLRNQAEPETVAADTTASDRTFAPHRFARAAASGQAARSAADRAAAYRAPRPAPEPAGACCTARRRTACDTAGSRRADRAPGGTGCAARARATDRAAATVGAGTPRRADRAPGGAGGTTRIGPTGRTGAARGADRAATARSTRGAANRA